MVNPGSNNQHEMPYHNPRPAAPLALIRGPALEGLSGGSLAQNLWTADQPLARRNAWPYTTLAPKKTRTSPGAPATINHPRCVGARPTAANGLTDGTYATTVVQ